ncbi:hypothetical protein BDV97DRAFT_359239 [Delphinella strobiligena]|nr:hypothetical protein BDV97DRAFT_359239 [Delphinella strobiligena]
MTNGHAPDEDAAWYYEGQYTTAPSSGQEPSRHVLAPITQTPDALSSSAQGYQFVYPSFAPTNLDSSFAPGRIVHARPLTNGAYYENPSQMHVQTMEYQQNNVAQYQQQVHVPGANEDYLDPQLRQMQTRVFEHLEHSPLEPLQPSPFDNYRQLSFEQHLRALREQEQELLIDPRLRATNEEDQPNESQVSPAD